MEIGWQETEIATNYEAKNYESNPQLRSSTWKILRLKLVVEAGKMQNIIRLEA